MQVAGHVLSNLTLLNRPQPSEFTQTAFQSYSIELYTAKRIYSDCIPMRMIR